MKLKVNTDYCEGHTEGKGKLHSEYLCAGDTGAYCSTTVISPPPLNMPEAVIKASV